MSTATWFWLLALAPRRALHIIDALALALALMLAACGGSVAFDPPAPDAGASVECVPADENPLDSGTYDTCGNIRRMTEAGTWEYGCCVGATPECRNGVCIPWTEVGDR